MPQLLVNGSGAFEDGAAKLEVASMFKSTLRAATAFAALLLCASLALAHPAAAKSAKLAGDDLRAAVTGKTVYLNISGFELPIRYAAGGIMSGSMGAVAAALARGDGASDHGKWWIAGDQLCQRWTSWLDGKTYCYSFTVSGNVVHWVRNDGDSGTARIGS